MNDLYGQGFAPEDYSLNPLDSQALELVSPDFTEVNLPETESGWQEMPNQEYWNWQNETMEAAFNYQPDESWQDVSHCHQDFHYESPEALINDIPHQELGFTGLGNVHLLADLQTGPTCGYETIENIVQCFHTDITNNFSDQLQIDYPGRGGALNPEDYQEILSSYDIPSHWANFDHQELANALDENRPVVFVGDAHNLDPISYPDSQSWHAITLTDVSRNLDGDVIGYRGIDSNFPYEEKFWSCSQIEQANEQLTGEVLITDKPAEAWPFKTT